MAHNKNHSPVEWYVVSFLLRFVESNDTGADDDEARFRSWENTILVSAKSMHEAHKKGMKHARDATKPYKGGADGVRVQWRLVGITDITPVYEKLGDGTEIMWTDRAPRKLKNLKQLVKPAASFRE